MPPCPASTLPTTLQRGSAHLPPLEVRFKFDNQPISSSQLRKPLPSYYQVLHTPTKHIDILVSALGGDHVYERVSAWPTSEMGFITLHELFLQLQTEMPDEDPSVIENILVRMYSLFSS